MEHEQPRAGAPERFRDLRGESSQPSEPHARSWRSSLAASSRLLDTAREHERRIGLELDRLDQLARAAVGGQAAEVDDLRRPFA